MDIISRLQEQANTIASLAFNTLTLQRDAPPHFQSVVGDEEAQTEAGPRII
ncbi:hypothetical protein MKW92_045946 [Papaver armeniacum]|nr:hypothetical protein MKW92_045946 [Papaver armeniacum]